MPNHKPHPDPVLQALRLISAGESLDEATTSSAFNEIMAGRASPVPIAGLLVGLRARGESAEEVAGAALALRAAMLPVDVPNPDELVDTCGTGGGSIKTLNISTAAAFVVAGAGIRVAKHGNRSFTSRSGSADVLEALGVQVEANLEAAPRAIESAGIGFLYAPSFHPAMRHVGPVRRELGVPTIMNLVGPLANPAGVGRQVVGVSEAKHGALLANALLRLGTHRALVVHARIGMDEISPVGLTDCWELSAGAVVHRVIDPATFGMATPDMLGTEGGEPEENAAAILLALREPHAIPEALKAAIVLNAAAGVWVGSDDLGMADAVDSARQSLESGQALKSLEKLRAASPLKTSG